MHRLGREIKVTLIPPCGRPRTLLHINDWDFRWQEQCVLAQPLAVPRGSRLDLEVVYDNSAANPHNPSRSPRLVLYGSRLEDELCLVYLGVAPREAGRLKPLQSWP
jgi:hypothetical protein